MNSRESPIIVALDFSAEREARLVTDALDPGRCAVKVGKELFTSVGPTYVRHLVNDGFAVFLDLKFHDIPNTVARACKAAASLGVWMLNVHASGGVAMLGAARDALPTQDAGPLLIGVTVLTSLSEQDLHVLGIPMSPEEAVVSWANLCAQEGLDGVVCSPLDLSSLAASTLDDAFLRVTPGIRPVTSDADDQKRVMTPHQALDAGAHYLVVGRPITAAPDPMEALSAIEKQLST